ncbi:Cytidine and deoxycytidylate deaminase zinc-binding region [Roseivivax lentus]|uniref:Cytidine and deoxycytidylate deaminase zinc-binding region n=1 Tax=Roseivivax lentus TaxID=633194 RepID=A0A1N7K3Z0_9RHOB|nr:nucleoside deaminase [Roseivivax lentus]SIS56268.1 Cytidine and deoxycytidylate deaminase zinc-binding region [Roseivivax lentus]
MSFALTETEEEALDQVIARARALHDGTGPVFTAAIVQDTRIVAVEANEVAETTDPTRHAEVVAIARAARALGSTDLSGSTLIASMQPCEMCLAAMRWAGIDRLVFAMTQDEAPDFFQFPQLRLEDYARATQDAFAWRGGVRIAEVRHIYGGSE